jgi:hypothetical protein
MDASPIDFYRKIDKTKHTYYTVKVTEDNIQWQYKVPIFGAEPFNQPEDLLATASAFLRVVTRLGWDFDIAAEQFESCLDETVLHEWQTTVQGLAVGATLEDALEEYI